MMKRWLALAGLLMTLTGCVGNVDFEIDNPTERPLILAVNEQRHTVPAHTAIALSLAPGEYRLHNDIIGDVRMIVYAGGRGGLINPTLSEYVIASEEYGGSNSQSRAPAEAEIELDDVLLEGPYKKVSGLFIERDWNYGPRKAFPELIYSNHPEDVSEVKTKIFSVPDFIAYFEESTEQPGAYAEHNPQGYRAPPAVLTYTPAQLPDLHPLFDAQAKAIRDHHAQYLRESDPKEQARLKKEGHNVSVAYIKATVNLHRELSVKDSQQQNAFTTAFQLSRGMSAAILPVTSP